MADDPEEGDQPVKSERWDRTHSIMLVLTFAVGIIGGAVMAAAIILTKDDHARPTSMTGGEVFIRSTPMPFTDGD